MIFRILLPLLFLFQSAFAQESDLTVAGIPENLKENADAVVRLNKIDVDISSRKSMSTKQTRIVTVINENGLDAIDAYEYFDKSSTSIKSIEATIFDAKGMQLKKIKRKDFKDLSASGGAMFTDSRVLKLDYTPTQYPFTIVFTSETESSNTAFLPKWLAIAGSNTSMQKNVIKISCVADLGFKYKEYNFEGVAIQKEQSANTVSFIAENIPALKDEDYSPSIMKVTPYVLFGLEKFHLEGVDGDAKDWELFGTWYFNKILAGTDEVLPETVAKIQSIVGGETDLEKKAALVYNYVQSKTRYVSIALGIGGWKPMAAKDVDRLGYGDCKALSNYTRALLKAVGVESYYTIIYGDRHKQDMQEDFVSMQGNHIILAVPNKDKMIWLECTNQTIPFGYQGSFTDDRLALIVKPQKSQIIRTGIYTSENSIQKSKGNYNISDKGTINGSVMIVSTGIQYESKYFLSEESKENRDKFYKSAFRNINNLKLKKTDLKNDRELKEFTEDIVFEAEGYCNKSGDRLIFSVNAFNQYSSIPQRYRNRKNPFEILRGFLDSDEIAIDLPEGYSIESKPDDVIIKDKFGEYTAKYTISESGTIVYTRSLLVTPGYYANNEYENFRQFREKIARNDNAKIVLLKK